MGVALSNQELWNQIKAKIQKNSNSGLVRSALTGVKMELKKNQFTLVAPSLFHQKILREQISCIQKEIKEKGLVLKDIKTLSPKEGFSIRDVIKKKDRKNHPLFPLFSSLFVFFGVDFFFLCLWS